MTVSADEGGDPACWAHLVDDEGVLEGSADRPACSDLTTEGQARLSGAMPGEREELGSGAGVIAHEAVQ